jgi:hypothetical protein
VEKADSSRTLWELGLEEEPLPQQNREEVVPLNKNREEEAAQTETRDTEQQISEEEVALNQNQEEESALTQARVAEQQDHQANADHDEVDGRA